MAAKLRNAMMHQRQISYMALQAPNVYTLHSIRFLTRSLASEKTSWCAAVLKVHKESNINSLEHMCLRLCLLSLHPLLPCVCVHEC